MFLSVCFCVSLHGMNRDMDLSSTTQEIIRHLYNHHQIAHQGLDNPQTTYYSGAPTIPGLKITSHLPVDDNGDVELKINVLDGNSSDLQKALLEVARQNMVQPEVQAEDEVEIPICDRITGYLFSCVTPRKTYRRQADIPLTERAIQIDPYTTLIVQKAASDNLFTFRTTVKKSVLDAYLADKPRKDITGEDSDPDESDVFKRMVENVNLVAETSIMIAQEPDDSSHVGVTKLENPTLVEAVPATQVATTVDNPTRGTLNNSAQDDDEFVHIVVEKTKK